MQAAIDVGSNTVRLLLGSIQDGQVIPELYVRRITRLKGGQTQNGLDETAMQRTLIALAEFSALLSQYKPTQIRAVATEALRSAVNRQSFLKRAATDTGLQLEIIDGNDEALLSARGDSSVIGSDHADNILIFDIGGGSTEFILLRRGEILFQRSLPLGVVDLTEAAAGEHRPSTICNQVSSIAVSVNDHLQRLPATERGVTLVGTAGTVTTLAALEMQMHVYDWRRVNGYKIDLLRIEHRYKQLRDLSVDEREELPGMEPGRGDLIIAGIEIILEIMHQFRADILTVSDFGLLEGILLTMPSISDSKR